MKISTRLSVQELKARYSIRDIENFLVGIHGSTTLKGHEKQNIDQIMANPEVDIYQLWHQVSNLHRDRINGDELIPDGESDIADVERIEDNIIYVDFRKGA